MRGKLTLLAGVCAGAIAFPAYAQEAASDNAADNPTEIVVTAQRTAQKLQDVPIAVSAFNAESLDKQQIKNTSDLQLTLPNITFTKTNFTGSSFTIRGIGDLCVGVTCDQATAIHMNDAPLFATRLFEGEFYDVGQIEVLRGPQGTLFGRNATSGVVNIKSARPSLSGLAANAEAEYGNYNGVKVKGMVNVPLGETLAVRMAGYYLSRDGYTMNTYTGDRQDGRDMYGLRGSLRFEPTSGTTIDMMVQYFHENDSRMRAQKMMCQNDPTGILGCLNGKRAYEMPNGNATLAAILTSREFLTSQLGAALGSTLALGSVYSPTNYYTGETNPADPRVVHSDYAPTYYTTELIAQGSLNQELGGGLNLKLSGNYQKVKLDSRQDYNSAVINRSGFAAGLLGLTSLAGTAPYAPYFSPIKNALIPGVTGAGNVNTADLCTSLPEETMTGVYGGHKICASTPLDFDRSNQEQSSWSTEAIISSKWDGMFNFLLGGIYSKMHLTEYSYYVNAFGLDYAAGVLGAATALGGGMPTTAGNSYFMASPFYRNNSDDLSVTSYGLFGEAYVQFNDTLKLTLGMRYNNDEKTIRARTTLASWLMPMGVADAASTPFGAQFESDQATACPFALSPAGALGSAAGCEAWQVRTKSFSAWTGRAVLDWKITPDNLIYFSYSRGYKSGGINPPLSPVFSVSETFKPEFVDAFEIGSKNTFGNLQLNLTGFYYKYKDLQLSRIVARTSVNDNVSANIWGLEAEAIFRPTRELTVNLTGSYLHAEVSQDKWLSNPRDFGGGRSDAVIIKDVTNASNCAVSSNVGSQAQVGAYVAAVNNIINGGVDTNPLKPGLEIKPGTGLSTSPTMTSFGAGSGIASTGAFSICGLLQNLAPTLGASFGGITFGSPGTGSPGIDVNIKGNKLPGAPDYKFSAGVQYDAAIGDLTLTPRADFVYTGKSVGNIFGGAINEIPSFTQVNAQIQLDGPDKKWFVRGWVQNVFENQAITGLYVTDQSSGNYTNIFTLEPRRYGMTAGLKF